MIFLPPGLLYDEGVIQGGIFVKKILIVLGVVCSFLLSGCTSASNTKKITLNGSTSMQKLVTAVGESFSNDNTAYTVESQFTGSSAGIEAVVSGTALIGTSSRDLKSEETAKGLVANVVAIDGIAVIVNPSNGVKNVTKQELSDIYTGKIKNWKDLGGKDERIVVLGREASSGTRTSFEELLKIENKCVYAQEIDNTGAVAAKVGSISGAIGYVGLDALSDNVRALKIDGVACNATTIKKKAYFLQRNFIMVTKGPLSKQSTDVQKFFAYIRSSKGQTIIKNVGLVGAE